MYRVYSLENNEFPTGTPEEWGYDFEANSDADAMNRALSVTQSNYHYEEEFGYPLDGEWESSGDGVWKFEFHDEMWVGFYLKKVHESMTSRAIVYKSVTLV